MIWITSTEINRSGRIVNDSVGHEESNSKDYLPGWEDGESPLFTVKKYGNASSGIVGK